MDLLNNAKYLTEDVSELQTMVEKNLNQFDKAQLKILSAKYGKVGTKKFVSSIIGS